jgi:hypothetical protein
MNFPINPFYANFKESDLELACTGTTSISSSFLTNLEWAGLGFLGRDETREANETIFG